MAIVKTQLTHTDNFVAYVFSGDNGNETVDISELKLSHQTLTGRVYSTTITNDGAGYQAVPTVTFSAPTTGTRATGTANLVATNVDSIAVASGGDGYSSAPTVTISEPDESGGVQATATAVLGTGTNSDKVASINMVQNGTGYTKPPTVTFSGGDPDVVAVAGKVTLDDTEIDSITIVNEGEGYVTAPTITISEPDDGTDKATATCTISQKVNISDIKVITDDNCNITIERDSVEIYNFPKGVAQKFNFEFAGYNDNRKNGDDIKVVFSGTGKGQLFLSLRKTKGFEGDR